MRALGWTLAVGLATACASDAEPESAPALPDVPAADAQMRRLTAEQYVNVISDVLGADLVLTTVLEPDTPSGGLVALGAARTALSELGVERYETAAFELAEQAIRAPESDLIPCATADRASADCLRAFVVGVGRRLWRRPLTVDETDVLVGVGVDAAQTLGAPDAGFEYALAALLQSPHFIYRNERPTPDALDEWALASRLSFLLWNTSPDERLLDAAEQGELQTDEGLSVQVDRLLRDRRARRGVRAFFSDLLELHRLDDMVKDPTLFVHFDAELGPSAREQTLLDVERLVFDLDGDYRDLFTTAQTHVNRRLAATYGVPASSREGFALVDLSPADGRRGLLGQVSFLALHSHAVATSAVLRGRFVRTALLCGEIPAPPVDVNTALPEPTDDARTLRDRNRVHLENENCAACHQLMDPIGLGLENFDPVGRWRSFDNGARIDASGVLDGAPFADAWSLAERLRAHPQLAPCFVRQLYRYAVGQDPTADEDSLVDVLAARFAAGGYRVQALLVDIVMSSGFRGLSEDAR